MNTELVKSKIVAIQNVIPSINEFLEKGFDKDYATQILADYSIILNENIILESKISFLDFFNKNVKLNLSFFGFSLSEQEDFEDFTVIGNRDSDSIIVIKKTNEIALFDQYNSEILGYLAEDFEMFLDLIPVLISYDKLGYLGEEYSTSLKKNTLKKLKEILKSKKYYSFFDQSISCE